MLSIHGEQQKKEIETIKPRILEIKLSDTDVKRLAEKAGAHGLSVSGLLEAFIGDLVCGTYSNGSDERMYAEQWFERFEMFPEETFLKHLIGRGYIDEVLRAWDGVERNTLELDELEKQLQSGVMKNNDGTFYTWKDFVNLDNEPFYASKEEWEAELLGELEAIKDEIASDREIILECWSKYNNKKKDYQNRTLDEEMEKVLEWRQEYSKLLGNEV